MKSNKYVCKTGEGHGEAESRQDDGGLSEGARGQGDHSRKLPGHGRQGTHQPRRMNKRIALFVVPM